MTNLLLYCWVCFACSWHVAACTRVVATLKGFVHSEGKQVSLDFGKLIGMPKLFVNSLLGAIAQVAWPAARPMAYGNSQDAGVRVPALERGANMSFTKGNQWCMLFIFALGLTFFAFVANEMMCICERSWMKHGKTFQTFGFLLMLDLFTRPFVVDGFRCRLSH